LDGAATPAYAVSFIVTNLSTHNDSEQGRRSATSRPRFRRRADIKDRIRVAKLGAALRQLPSAHTSVNPFWMWAARLTGGNLSVLPQALTGIDEHVRAHAARLRHKLLCVPARPIRPGHRLTLRRPPGQHLPPSVRSTIRELNTAA